MVEFTADLLILVDVEGIIVDFNRSVPQNTGFPRTRIYGQNLCMLFGQDTAEEMLRVGLRRFQSAVQLIGNCRRADGSEFPAEIKVTRFPNTTTKAALPGHGPRNRTWAMVISARDITQRRKRERALQESREAVSRLQHEVELRRALQRQNHIESIALLAGGIAHDLNNILGAVYSNIELMQIGETANTDGILIDDAKDGLIKARDVVTRLLTFAKGGTPILNPIKPQEWLPQAIKGLSPGGGLTIKIDIHDDLPVIQVDEAQLAQVISNLLVNAQQAVESVGEVNVCAKPVTNQTPKNGLPPGEYLSIAVTDQGCGIPAELRERIFEPFFTTKISGSGLGLSTVYRIIKAHGGALTVDSVPDQGSCFTILLPSAIPNTATLLPADTLATHVLPSNTRILVMDDEPRVRNAIRTVLKRLGAEVTICNHGEAAIEHLERANNEDCPYHIALLDLSVPNGRGGLWALEQLHSASPQTKAIACSGYTEARMGERFNVLGFAGYIPKPFTIQQLTETLTEALKSS